MPEAHVKLIATNIMRLMVDQNSMKDQVVCFIYHLSTVERKVVLK